MVFDDICDTQLLDDIYELSLKEGKRIFPFFEKGIFSQDDILFNKIQTLVFKVWIDHLDYLLPENFKGWEIWYNLIGENEKLHAHIDIDEKRSSYIEDVVFFPNWGCIIYPGPKKSIVGGDFVYNLDLKDTFLKDPIKSSVDFEKDLKHHIKIPYRYNRVVVFNQSVHAVTPVESLNGCESRLSIACAVWDYKVNPITSEKRDFYFNALH